ncbi:hypothetical protein Droror1_Dr00020616, partial [Drosera rotundifolia]
SRGLYDLRTGLLPHCGTTGKSEAKDEHLCRYQNWDRRVGRRSFGLRDLKLWNCE